ncbi:hypothetical protein GQ472_06725 [archaeon]|nr:hypothetical protein [archaeon]
MGIEVSLEGGADITEKYIRFVYDGKTVDMPLYVSGKINEDFALLYHELDWEVTRFDELASDQIKEIKKLINEDKDFYHLDSYFRDGAGSYYSDECFQFLKEIDKWGDKLNGMGDDGSKGEDVYDSYLGVEPVKNLSVNWVPYDSSDLHGFNETQSRIIGFLGNVSSKVYSLNQISDGVGFDRDDIWKAVKSLLRGGYLAHSYDPDVKKKRYDLTGKHLNVSGEKPLHKHPLAVKPRKFESMWSCDVYEKIVKYLFYSKNPVGTVIDLAERLNIDPGDAQSILNNLIEEGVVDNGDNYTLSSVHLEMLGSLPKRSDGTLEKYYLDA